MRLYDTLSRETRSLAAADGQRYRMYVCGPTVYGPAHIGNLLTIVRADLLYRTLRAAGLNPFYVRNITDVDDKTIRDSSAEGTPLREFTQKWTEKFHADCEALNCLPPDGEPRATDNIDAQVTLVEQLLKDGHAYVGGDGSVYFRVTSFDDYGKLSHFDREELRTQARNSAGQANDADEYERDQVADFALWKAWKPEDGEVFWAGPKSPETGEPIKGRPGWHLECSAMSHEHLEKPFGVEGFDLHGGGEDLVFPHHENEIAQSCCGYHTPFAEHWWHNRHLLVEGKKMSKSAGNFFRLGDLLEKGYSTMAIRFAFLQGHYRQQLNFTEAGLRAGESALKKLRKAVEELLEQTEGGAEALAHSLDAHELDTFGEVIGQSVFKPAWEKLADDLNTPATLGAIFSALNELGKRKLTAAEASTELKALGGLFFALGIDPRAEETAPGGSEIPADIAEKAQQRWEAKQARDFATADALRDEIQAAGWKILDRKDGYDLEQA